MTVLRRLVSWLVAAAAAAAAAAVVAAARPRPAPPSPVAPPRLPPGRTVDLGDRGEAFVRELSGPGGDAPTVALVHGWMAGTSLNWHAIMHPLAQRARVVAVELPGHGLGSRPCEPFRLADAVDDVAATLRAIETGPAIVVGYSLGGAVAQLLWQRHPDVVAGMVLVATAAAFREDRRQAWGLGRAMPLLQTVLRLAPRTVVERLVRAQVAGWLPFEVTRMVGRHSPPEVLERLGWVVAELSRHDPEDVAQAGRELGRFDSRGWLPTVDVPCAVVRTTRDRLVPPQSQAELAGLLGAPCRDVDLDHDAPLAAGPALAEAIGEAIDDVGGRR